MSTKSHKVQKRNFRRKQLCPKCLKGQLEPCNCGCLNQGNTSLICNVCKFTNY